MSSVDECVTIRIVALTILRRSLRFGAAPSRGPCSIHTKPMCTEMRSSLCFRRKSARRVGAR
jgi:hypothetical protein